MNISNHSFPVRGYIKPMSSFHTIDEWETIALKFLYLQKQGYDIRGFINSGNSQLVNLVKKYFGYTVEIETELFPKMFPLSSALIFIEDFVNHKIWGLRREYLSYFKNIDELKFGYFYSRGDIEPYVLLDDKYTNQFYGNIPIEVKSYHWTTIAGLKNINKIIQKKENIAISTFTKQSKRFFRQTNNVLSYIRGELIAGFKSDVKSMAVDNGMRAANLTRFAYPNEQSNILLDIKDITNETSLWNELIVYPRGILKYEKKYNY